MLDKMNIAERVEHDAIRLEQDTKQFIERHRGAFSYHTLSLQSAVTSLETAYDALGKLLAGVRRDAA